MTKNIRNISITAIMALILTGFLACNYEAQLNFPDTDGSQITVSSISYTERSGDGDGVIVRGNTVLFTLNVENAYNDTYTVTWTSSDDSFPLTESGGATALWTSPYSSGQYYHSALVNDGEHTSMGVCQVMVTNTVPEILSIDFLENATGNNTIHLTVKDADTFPETTIYGSAAPDTGTVFDITSSVVNEGSLDFLWMPDGCTEGITVSVEMKVTDDDPDNTVAHTVEFWYQP